MTLAYCSTFIYSYKIIVSVINYAFTVDKNM